MREISQTAEITDVYTMRTLHNKPIMVKPDYFVSTSKDNVQESGRMGVSRSFRLLFLPDRGERAWSGRPFGGAERFVG